VKTSRTWAASRSADSSSAVLIAQCTLALSTIKTSPSNSAPDAMTEYTKSRKSSDVLLSFRGMDRKSGSVWAREVTSVMLYDLDNGTLDVIDNT